MDKRKIKAKEKPYSKMWFNPFNGFYSKDDPNLKVSSFVEDHQKISKSSKGMRSKKYRQSAARTRRDLRPKTGNRGNYKVTYAILDSEQGHTRVNSMANSKGFHDSDSKYNSMGALNNNDTYVLDRNQSEIQEISPKIEAGFHDFVGSVPETRDESETMNLLQKISLSENKAMINYSINQEEQEKNRRILVQIK